ncbi:MAG TPA: transposase [Rhodocyclaceae bacterium]|nr:transposase [Rhodocyclaceae bacterium]
MHIVQRGNIRKACFFADEDRRCYLDWLEDYALRHGCRMHAYVVMTNHVHFLLSPDDPDSVGAMRKALGQRYVQHVNRAYPRSGTLWEGRYRSCLVQDDRYLLNCMRYIELNPVRAGMVRRRVDHVVLPRHRGTRVVEHLHKMCRSGTAASIPGIRVDRA